MQVIKPFSKYVSALDSEGTMYSKANSTAMRTTDRNPTFIQRNEVLMLMNECDRLYSPDGIRARTIKCIIGLLWAAGMRPSEPVNLIRKDVDLAHACITVRETKFAKERIIPVSTSVIQALEEYMAIPHNCYDTHYRAATLARTEGLCVFCFLCGILTALLSFSLGMDGG